MDKTNRSKIAEPDLATTQDEVLTCCLNIKTLAELLECSNADLNLETVTRAGLLILKEVETLQEEIKVVFGKK